LAISETRLRAKLLEVSRELTDRGFIFGDRDITHGQVSVRIPGTDKMLIKPTHKDAAKVKLAEYVTVSLKTGEVVKAVPGLRPSSEADLHVAIYNARPEVGAIVHTHSPFAVAISTAFTEIVPWSDESLMLGGVRIVPRLDFDRAGQNKAVVEALGKDARCMVLARHGTISVGPDLDEAKMYAIELEAAAKVMFYAVQLPGSKPISYEDATKITGKPPRVRY
jgi:ribulose-5-phosphate 4-epimerase/fuculose-1-phosphate aldolase